MEDDQILLLNQRIKKLLTENEKLLQENLKVAKDNDKLKTELDFFKKDCSRSSQLYMQYKYDFEKETSIRKSIFEAHQKQKTKFISLHDENYKLKEKVKILENTIQNAKNSPCNQQQNRVTIIGSINDMKPTTISNTEHLKEIGEIKSKIVKLEQELDEAYDLIDELEFEVDSISYYESENERLQHALNDAKKSLKVMEDNVSMCEDMLDGELVDRQEEECEKMFKERQQKRAELHKKLESLHAKQSFTSPDKVKYRGQNRQSATVIENNKNGVNHDRDEFDDEFDDDEYFSAYLVDY